MGRALACGRVALVVDREVDVGRVAVDLRVRVVAVVRLLGDRALMAVVVGDDAWVRGREGHPLAGRPSEEPLALKLRVQALEADRGVRPMFQRLSRPQR